MFENTTSTEHQYGLRQRAVVLDDDTRQADPRLVARPHEAGQQPDSAIRGGGARRVQDALGLCAHAGASPRRGG